MDYAELKRRLTEHLAGEESTDFHTQAAREAAIKEAYLNISDDWVLSTAPLPAGPLPADFLSYAAEPGQYNRVPPALTSDTSEPWGGQYKQLHAAITYYAAFRLFQDKGPEMYERSMFWKGLYDEEGKRAQRLMVRQAAQELATSDANADTYGGLRSTIRFNLDKTDMTLEESRRMFPGNMVDAAILRAYREMTQELDLSVKTAILPLPEDSQMGMATVIPLPADFLSPLPEAAFTVQGEAVIGGAFPYGAQTEYVPSYSIGREGSGQFVTVQNFGLRRGSLLARYVSEPAPLVDQTDKPWGGLYPTGNHLIVARAMRDLLRSKEKTYNLSRFWQNEYDRDVIPFKKLLRRYNLGQANRVYMGHMSESTPVGFYPINGGEGNKGTENG